MNLYQVRSKLPLPKTLAKMLKSGRWLHPGDDVMRLKVPFICDPLVFLSSKDIMLRESGPLMREDEAEQSIFSEYRGSLIGHRELPWIDVEKTLFIISNKEPGDDVGIALDYRTGIDTPRIVGGDWQSGKNCIYREISPSFDDFVQLLGL